MLSTKSGKDPEKCSSSLIFFPQIPNPKSGFMENDGIPRILGYVKKLSTFFNVLNWKVWVEIQDEVCKTTTFLQSG
jgi:hypothetical protein